MANNCIRYLLSGPLKIYTLSFFIDVDTLNAVSFEDEFRTQDEETKNFVRYNYVKQLAQPMRDCIMSATSRADKFRISAFLAVGRAISPRIMASS